MTILSSYSSLPVRFIIWFRSNKFSGFLYSVFEMSFKIDVQHISKILFSDPKSFRVCVFFFWKGFFFLNLFHFPLISILLIPCTSVLVVSVFTCSARALKLTFIELFSTIFSVIQNDFLTHLPESDLSISHSLFLFSNYISHIAHIAPRTFIMKITNRSLSN